MTVAEFAGYVAAGLVFATFYMRTMIPLRIVGIASNVAFLAYSWLAGLVPIFVLHGALLPLNIWRLQQLRRLVQDVRESAAGELPIEGLLPFMTQRRAAAGEVLFRRGDRAHDMFYVVGGTIRLDELGRILGPGTMLGEISLFAPRHERTATAVCDSDVELLVISADKVMQLYHQNPRFGFHLVRLITGRLIENLTAAERRGDADLLRALESSPAEIVAGMDDTRPAAMLNSGLRHRLRRRRWSRLVAGGFVGLLLLYGGWHVAPYLRSTISRDSAVTSWIHNATSPIAGNTESRPAPGDRVGEDGLVATVVDRHSDPSAAERSAAEVPRAQAIVVELSRYLDGMRQLDAEWHARTVEHSASFRQNLEESLQAARSELEQVMQRLVLARGALERKQRLAQRGNASQSDTEGAQGLLAELELLRVGRERDIADLEVRRAAAEHGVYMTSEGNDPGWADRSRDELRRDIVRGQADLAEAEANLAMARRTADADAAALRRTSTSEVRVPPGSLVWSVVAGADAAVGVGDTIVQWLDCSAMLVDVPVSDVKVALLRPGMPANVVLEGDPAPRSATILLTRGSAGTLGLDNLAAVAKGRSSGRGQVLLQLQPTAQDVANCPIGLAAFVEFPDVDLLDIVRARLRL